MTNPTNPITSLELVEQIISAWAFAHNIDGAARNDFIAARATLSQHTGGVDV
jgi:hypothetical protein